MRIPATKSVEGTRFAVAVWRDEYGTWRYTVTHGEQPERVYNDPRDGWEPMNFVPKIAWKAAYLATRDADPPELVKALERGLLEAYRAAVKAGRVVCA